MTTDTEARRAAMGAGCYQRPPRGPGYPRRVPPLLPYADALDRVLEACRPGPVEEVPLAEAAGRVLARPAQAREPVPPFANSAMDGFAVRAADLASGPA